MTFIDKFILPVAVLCGGALLLNPMHFDVKQRISLAVAVAAVAYFFAHTADIHKKRAESEPKARQSALWAIKCDEEAALVSHLRAHSMQAGESAQRHVTFQVAAYSPENKIFADRLETLVRTADWHTTDGGTTTDRRYQQGIWLFGKGPSDPNPPSPAILQMALEKAGISTSVDNENKDATESIVVIGKKPD